MSSLRLLLYPVSICYAWIVKLRNFLFDAGIFKSSVYDLPLICIGNLKVGGTGKTPFTESLIRLLGASYNIATLSRGYGRKTKGLLMAGFPADATMVGDEPAQFKNKFPAIPVCVAEDRRTGIEALQKTGVQLILLDDAFQHRKVRCGLNIVLLEYADLFRPVLALPAGNYREPFSSLDRAAMVLVTKSPGPATAQLNQQVRERLKIRPETKLYFSEIVYDALLPLYQTGNAKMPLLSEIRQVVLLTGIARAEPLLTYLKSQGLTVIHQAYPDHHNFTPQNIRQLVGVFQAEKNVQTVLLTTEKDAQRLQSARYSALLEHLPFYYLPIRAEIASAERLEFESFIFDYVNSAL